MYPYIFFFNDTATTEIYTLSLHDALPISSETRANADAADDPKPARATRRRAKKDDGSDSVKAGPVWAFLAWALDRKSTRLNSSHANISYAVFCLKKNKIQ